MGAMYIHRQVGIPIVLESSLPVYQPQTVAVEEHIVGLEQVVMTRRQIRIEARVNRGHLLVVSEKFPGLVFRQNARRPELLEESVQGRSFVHQERACGIEWGSGKRRQRVQGPQRGRNPNQRVRRC